VKMLIVAAVALAFASVGASAQYYIYDQPQNSGSYTMSSLFLSPHDLLLSQQSGWAPQAAADAHRNAQLQADLMRQEIEFQRLRSERMRQQQR
jgi:hypothetical protein